MRYDSNPCMDKIASHLRSQIIVMHDVLETLERNHDRENDYISESIRSVEDELRRLRRFIAN